MSIILEGSLQFFLHTKICMPFGIYIYILFVIIINGEEGKIYISDEHFIYVLIIIIIIRSRSCFMSPLRYLRILYIYFFFLYLFYYNTTTTTTFLFYNLIKFPFFLKKKKKFF
jgi:hypothetical protein